MVGGPWRAHLGKLGENRTAGNLFTPCSADSYCQQWYHWIQSYVDRPLGRWNGKEAVHWHFMSTWMHLEVLQWEGLTKIWGLQREGVQLLCTLLFLPFESRCQRDPPTAMLKNADHRAEMANCTLKYYEHSKTDCSLTTLRGPTMEKTKGRGPPLPACSSLSPVATWWLD